MYTLANWLMAHLVGVIAAWWLIAPSPTVNAVAAVTLGLTLLWMRFVWVRRARRLASDYEDLTPNLITHGGVGSDSRWDRRSRRQDEIYGAETRGGHP